MIFTFKILLIVHISSIFLYAITNEEIAIKSYKITSGYKSSKSNMTMTLINARDQKTIRQMYSQSLENENGDKSLLTFLTPADVKGTKMLTHEYINKDDDQWMYLPALKRIKRIASRNKSGSFMGSEFSYEDTTNPNYKKFKYDNKIEIVILDGVEYYKGIRYPKDKYSGYSKQITYIDKQSFLVKKVEYYDRKKEHFKTAIFTKYEKIQDVWMMREIIMTNHQNSKSTILNWSNIKIKLNLTAKDFTKRKLKR
jgi:hypothetical protein